MTTNELRLEIAQMKRCIQEAKRMKPTLLVLDPSLSIEEAIMATGLNIELIHRLLEQSLLIVVNYVGGDYEGQWLKTQQLHMCLGLDKPVRKHYPKERF